MSGEALTGVTTRVEVLYKGSPALDDDEITGFNDAVNMETRTTRALGRASEMKNQIVRGYTGRISIETRSDLGRQFCANYIAEVKAGIKPDVSIIETSTHPDTGQQVTRQWVIVTIEGMERDFSTGGNVTGTYSWSSEERIG